MPKWFRQFHRFFENSYQPRNHPLTTTRNSQFFTNNLSPVRSIKYQPFATQLTLNSSSRQSQDRNASRIKFFNTGAVLLASVTVLSASDIEKDKVKSSKETLNKSKDTAVTIRIWLSDVTTGNVGHVSLQTFAGDVYQEGIYASYWPSRKAHSPLDKLGSLGSALIEHPDIDIRKMKRPPDKIITLYSLDVNKINKIFAEFSNSNNNWSLLASSCFRQENTQNCVSLVTVLLKEGGLGHLINMNFVPYHDGIKDGIEAAEAFSKAEIAANFPDFRYMTLFSIEMVIRTSLLISNPAIIACNPTLWKPNLTQTLLSAYINYHRTQGMLKAAEAIRKLGRALVIATPNDISAIVEYGVATEMDKYDLIESPVETSNNQLSL